jgi:hypothetical protein
MKTPLALLRVENKKGMIDEDNKSLFVSSTKSEVMPLLVAE